MASHPVLRRGRRTERLLHGFIGFVEVEDTVTGVPMTVLVLRPFGKKPTAKFQALKASPIRTLDFRCATDTDDIRLIIPPSVLALIKEN